MKKLILLFAVAIIFSSCASVNHSEITSYKEYQVKHKKHKKVRGGYSTSGVWRKSSYAVKVTNGCNGNGGFDSGSSSKTICPIGYFAKDGSFH